jgi:hypothetical protein
MGTIFVHLAHPLPSTPSFIWVFLYYSTLKVKFGLSKRHTKKKEKKDVRLYQLGNPSQDF